MPDLWKFVAGLIVFLLGLRFLELALKNLAGRSFKKFLRRQTTNPLKGIIGGAGITAVLQSSSVVSLMMIAFVGAGILTLHNAIGVIFGSNLGTTITGWIVAALGFEIDFADFAFPLVAIGGIAFIFFERTEKASEAGRFLLGFGLLFVGLAFMKESVDELSATLEPEAMAGLGLWMFFPVGLVLAAIIHSSSAVIVMALTALHADLMPVEGAAILVAGANLGTTSTVILGSIGGTPAQKQVALSHFLFNLVSAVIALALLYPLLRFISDILRIESPLFILVAFHTLFNFLGIVALFPVIGLMARLLERRFTVGATLTRHITEVSTEVPEAAIVALRKEILELTGKVLTLNIAGLRIEEGLFSYEDGKLQSIRPGTYKDHYEKVKQIHGEMVKYYLRIQNEKMEPEDSHKMNHYIHALKHLLKSAKSVKDVTHDIHEFETSSNDTKYALFKLLKGKVNELYLALHHLIRSETASSHFESLVELLQQNRTDYNYILTEAYRQAQAGRLSELEIATFLNANSEIYSANKSLIEAICDVLLSPQEADDFAKLPEMH